MTTSIPAVRFTHVSRHFGDAPIIEVSGRTYPVEVRYRPLGDDADDDRDQTQGIIEAVDELCREGQGDILVFLTNHLTFGATTIAAIYKDRWQIELFFKALKQNLKIKTFVGTSANALKVQVWTALIAMLILKYLQLRSRFAWSLSNLVALLRMNLFTHRDLWAWLDHPFAGPPTILVTTQEELALG